MRRWLLVCWLLLVSLDGVAATDLDKLAARYQHAIIQYDQPSVINARMRGFRSVSVTINGVEVSAHVGATQRDRVRLELPAMPVGGPYQMVFRGVPGRDGSEVVEVVADDVWLSDVWLCVGQSNMCFPMTKMHSADTWAPAVDDHFPGIRFHSGRNGWATAEGIDVIKNFAGTPYYFARALHRELGRPIGIKVAGRGGTTLWQWTPDELHRTAALEPLRQVMVERNAYITQLKAEGDMRDVRYQPNAGFSPYRYPYFPFEFGELANFENWIPTTPAAGIVFWQGENDIGLSANYEPLFGGMLARWRSLANREWPFVFIQLPTYSDGPGRGTKHVGIAGLRDAQRRVAAADPLSHMMVSYDIYGRGIHPSSKEAYGERLALTVLGMVYGHDVAWRSPEYQGIQVADDALVVQFAYVGAGLRPRGDEATLTGFTVAGEDGVFHPAEASVIAADQVQVRSAAVTNPVAVRYAWGNNPVANLVGDGDLPVSPFRSDDWELYPVVADDSAASP